MSKLFIPTSNCGKAHDADIFGVAICNPYTITCSGDGSIKCWKNRLLDTDLPKENVTKQFVDKTGIHHVDVLYSIEKYGIKLCIISCVAFSGKIYFFQINTSTNELTPLDLLTENDKKKSYWCVKWHKSSKKSFAHRFIATEVDGTTRIWKFHPFSDEIDESDLSAENVDNETIESKDNERTHSELNFHLTLQGMIPSSSSKFATCVDVSSTGLIATGFSDGSIVISQLSTLMPLYNFEGFGIKGTEENSSTVRDLKFSPLGTLLAVANDSGLFGCVSIYETEYGEHLGNLNVPIQNLKGHTGSFAHNGWVFNVSFNSTGEFLATCGYDARVRIWDVNMRERVSTLNISANGIDIEEDILLEDEAGDSLINPAVLGVTFINKGIRGGIGSDTNEGLCCVCTDRSVRWFREAGGV